jgi:excisionase family DNA binding protein
MERLLSIKEVSERLSIKENTLRAWVFQRRIPTIRLGRLVRFRESDLAAWVKAEEGVEYRLSRPAD